MVPAVAGGAVVVDDGVDRGGPMRFAGAPFMALLACPLWSIAGHEAAPQNQLALRGCLTGFAGGQTEQDRYAGSGAVRA